MSVRMTPDEAWSRVASAHTGIVTSLRRDGIPIATPMWFCVVDDAVHFRTPAASKKAGRLRHDPRIGFLVEGGERWAELWAVHLAGRAAFVTEPNVVTRVGEALNAKYASFKTERTEMPDATRTHYERPAAVIRIEAEARIVSWDNAKLGLQ
ncbi:MAG: pyridoxamine 5'-phosphate oxidase [Actinobacteria bacterium]|nr:pyridoxamine 5'-phosphate oxidase [Actinomycetota bacterium]